MKQKSQDETIHSLKKDDIFKVLPPNATPLVTWRENHVVLASEEFDAI